MTLLIEYSESSISKIEIFSHSESMGYFFNYLNFGTPCHACFILNLGSCGKFKRSSAAFQAGRIWWTSRTGMTGTLGMGGEKRDALPRIKRDVLKKSE
jgi:hypothetical protein